MTSQFEIGLVASKNNIKFDVERSDEWKRGWEEGESDKKILASLSPDQHLERIKIMNNFNLQEGVDFGWWESVEKGKPVPFPKTISVDDLAEHENTMAHVMVRLGIFESVSEAKKNNWNIPIKKGDFTAKKKTVRVRVI